ncbi:MAG: class I SAM-dependent methyltransferase [gamma proteobacterium symbiont of Taylorina sp.]|nr:class I SAM-dependent methyltransferase [gamma proteobacterium symbiont of Taylorina sp.]
MISIIPANNDLIKQAQNLAKYWGFNFTTNNSEIISVPFYLQLTSDHLQLVQTGKKSPAPIYIDFTSGSVAHRRFFGGGKGQTIAKAVGLNKTANLTILDATAGMGKDAFVFASLGAQVILMERSPVAAALLNDALNRAALDEHTAELIKRMSLIHGDSHQLLSNINLPTILSAGEDVCKTTADKFTGRRLNKSIILDQEPDIIYLDPMFPHRNKAALVKKEMLAFQQLIGDDADSDELLVICKKAAKKRVVVKRPIKAPYLNNCKPSYSMPMKKHRFDVYGCTSVV